MSKRFLSPINLLSKASDPPTGSNGDLYFNTSSSEVKIYYNSTWNSLAGAIGEILVSDNPPSTPIQGVLWYESDTGNLYIYYDSFWVQVNGGGGSGLPGGGTAGQILAKIDATSYNTEWIDNYTSSVKHLVKAGESLTKGQAVYVSSATGTNMIVSKASNTSDATSARTMGLIDSTLALNDMGFVVTEGLLAGLNTNSATIGDPVWLGTNGNLLYGFANKPIAPAHLVYIGVVTRVSATNGEIFVHVANGYEIEELHDVLITSVADNHILSYDNATSLWKNQALVDAVKEIDGTGSGIDADLLDGQHGSYYLDWTNTTNKPDPTITLGGDLSGSLTLTDLAGGTLTATIVANSVELGTDTTGNYVATIAGTTDQISVTGSGSESAAITLSTPQNIATTSSPTFAGATLDAVQIGITTAGEIDTTSGNLTIDSAGGTVTIDDNLIVSGDLTVNGTTTTIDTTTLLVEDKNIELGVVAIPTDTTADGGGITLRGTTNKTFNWVDSTDSWTSSEHIDLVSGKVIKVAGTEVLSATQYTGNAATVTNGVYTNGSYSNPSWITSLSETKVLPSQTSNSGKYLTTNGTSTSWATVDALPSQDGNSGKYLITNGTVASWATLDLSTKADINSPTFTGIPSAPTAVVDTNTTQIATTAYVIGQGYLKSATASSTYAPLASPTFTGTLTSSLISLTTADTVIAASHYFVETASDGNIRPKTLANVRTEIVTTTAVNSAAATTVGTITTGTWNASLISLTYGGTNANLTAANGGIVYSTASAMAITAAGTAGQVLTSNGASAPTWQTPSAAGFDAFLLSGM